MDIECIANGYRKDIEECTFYIEVGKFRQIPATITRWLLYMDYVPEMLRRVILNAAL